MATGVQIAVKRIAQQLKRPILDRTLTYSEGEVILSFLKQNKVESKDLEALFAGLRKAGVEAQFFQTAHPRWGMYVRDWLRDNGVPWSTIHAHYEYDLRDSIDFYAGFLAGMGVALADLPIMLAKLGKITIDGKLAEEASKFFKAIEQLWHEELKTVLETVAAKWVQEFDDLIFRLEWFKAGYQLGKTITNVVVFGKGAAKMIAGLPKFVKMVPAAAKEISAVVQRTSSIVVRTTKDAIVFLKAVWGTLFVVPDFRFSRLLPAILSPGELRQLLAGKAIRMLTKTGFELIYVESTKVEDGVMTLRTGVLPSDFVPASVVIVRRNGKVIGRIFDPRSLAHAWKDLSDDDIGAAIDLVLRDPAVPPMSLSPEDMRKLVDRALKSADFAETAASLNLRLLAEEFAQVASKRVQAVLQKIKALPTAKPSAATFGTQVESDMRPVLLSWQNKFPHLTFHRNETLKSILGSRMPERYLKMTVEDFVRANPALAEQLGFDGKNLAKVLVADGKTLIGDLRVDLFIEDAFGHQGLLLDWTSFFSEAHFGKTLLYHSVISDVIRNMRLPFGEMFHMGFIN